MRKKRDEEEEEEEEREEEVVSGFLEESIRFARSIVMERDIRNRNGIGIPSSDVFCDREPNRLDHSDSNGGYSTPSSSSSSSSAVLPQAPGGFIEHTVSKMDTLAGVAIKYGVEVVDIKKMNGLVTDLQMFALKSIQIPLPGRHPPSPCLTSAPIPRSPRPSSCEQSPPRRIHRDLFDSFQSLRVKSPQQQVSPAMSSLQGYYGLKSKHRQSSSESIEMSVYRKGIPNYLDDGVADAFEDHHRKSKSFVNGYTGENGETPDTLTVSEANGDSDKWGEKLIRRRQKSETDFSRTPEKILEDNSGSNGGFSSITGKQLALRPKGGNRSAMAAEFENGGLNQIPVGMGDSFIADGFLGVRKSSSTPSLQEPENGGSMSIWSASKWSLKPDVQSFATSAIAKPIFDGLPPITGRRSKAALD